MPLVDSQPTLVILDRSKTQPEESLRVCQPGQSHTSIHPSPLQGDQERIKDVDFCKEDDT